MPEGREGKPSMGERPYETGTDEYFKAASQNMVNNMKLTYDAQQNLITNALKQAQEELTQINAVTLAALSASQNAISLAQVNATESANMIGKQAIAHRDIAIDREWNIDEQGYTAARVLNSDTFRDSIKAAVVAAVAEAISKKE